MEQSQSSNVWLVFDAHTGMPQRTARPLSLTPAMHFTDLEELVRKALNVAKQKRVQLNLLEGNQAITEQNFSRYLKYTFKAKEADQSVDLLVSIQQSLPKRQERLTYLKSRSQEEGRCDLSDHQDRKDIVINRQHEFNLRIRPEPRKILNLQACMNIKNVGAYLSTLRLKDEQQPFMEPHLWIEEPLSYRRAV